MNGLSKGQSFIYAQLSQYIGAKEEGRRQKAEGIETQGEADALISQEYERLQGFLYSRPEPLDTLLARYKS